MSDWNGDLRKAAVAAVSGDVKVQLVDSSKDPITGANPTPVAPQGEDIAFLRGQMTDVAAATELEIAGLPDSVIVRSFHLVLASGDGSTITPVLGRLTNPTGISAKVVGTPGASVFIAGLYVPIETDSGSLYLRPVPDSGSNNVVDYDIAYTAGV